MHRSLRITVIAATILALSACSSPAAEPSAPISAAPAAPTAADIETMDDGIAWARSLTTSTTATELSAGMGELMDLVPEQDIWFSTSNKIGQELNALNAEVLAGPGDAGTKVDDLNSIVDDIEEAIAHGNNP